MCSNAAILSRGRWDNGILKIWIYMWHSFIGVGRHWAYSPVRKYSKRNSRKTLPQVRKEHYSDVIMGWRLTPTPWRLCTRRFIKAQIKENIKSSASLAFVWEIHWWPVNPPHKWPVMRKMFPFDDVIMCTYRKELRGSVPRIHRHSLLYLRTSECSQSQTASVMGPTWGPPVSSRPQMDPILAPWTLLSGMHRSGW